MSAGGEAIIPTEPRRVSGGEFYIPVQQRDRGARRPQQPQVGVVSNDEVLTALREGNELLAQLINCIVGGRVVVPAKSDRAHDSSPTGLGQVLDTPDLPKRTVGELSTVPLPPRSVAPGEAVRDRSAYTTNERSPGL